MSTSVGLGVAVRSLGHARLAKSERTSSFTQPACASLPGRRSGSPLRAFVARSETEASAAADKGAVTSPWKSSVRLRTVEPM